MLGVLPAEIILELNTNMTGNTPGERLLWARFSQTLSRHPHSHRCPVFAAYNWYFVLFSVLENGFLSLIVYSIHFVHQGAPHRVLGGFVASARSLSGCAL